MVKHQKIEFIKTYKTPKNAHTAAGKLDKLPGNLRYLIVPVEQEDGSFRYGVLFLGMDAVQAGVHFHFNVVA